MAKKQRLSEKEQIRQFHRKRRRGILLRIMTVIIAVAVIVPLSYQAYYTVVFSLMPMGDYDPEKRCGAGYSKPLKIVDEDDHRTYTLAYYYGNCWHVVDDTQAIKDNISRFIVYKTDHEWHEDSDLQLFVFQYDYVLSHQPLSPFTLIDDRCFRKCMKKMSPAEFEAYCKERKIDGIYIFD